MKENNNSLADFIINYARDAGVSEDIIASKTPEELYDYMRQEVQRSRGSSYLGETNDQTRARAVSEDIPIRRVEERAVEETQLAYSLGSFLSLESRRNSFLYAMDTPTSMSGRSNNSVLIRNNHSIVSLSDSEEEADEKESNDDGDDINLRLMMGDMDGIDINGCNK